MGTDFTYMIIFIMSCPIIKPIYMVNFRQTIVFMHIFRKQIAFLVDLYYYVG